MNWVATRSGWLTAPIVALIVSGCVGSAGNGAGPASKQAEGQWGMEGWQVVEVDAAGGTWRWSDVAEPGLHTNFGVGLPADLPLEQVRKAMPMYAARPVTLTATVSHDETHWLRLGLWDQTGIERCSTNGTSTLTCHLPLYEPLGRVEWMAGVTSVRATMQVPFEVEVQVQVWDPWQPEPTSYRAGIHARTPPGLEAVRTLVHPSGQSTREPSLGITDDGALFTNQLDGVLRSSDGGRSWRFLFSQSNTGILDGDPWVWVDKDTGRLFRLALQVGCSWAAISDDEGQTWMQVPTAGCGQPGHHYQKLTTGPPPLGTAMPDYPNIAYYSASQLIPDPTSPDRINAGTRTWASTSRDGGMTWGPAVEVHPLRLGCPNLAGPIVVDANGVAYSGGQYCDGIRVARSTDGGASWHDDAFFGDVGIFGGLLGADMAVDTEGRAYIVHHGRDGHAYLHVRDTDGTWSEEIDVTPPGVRASTMAVIESGEPGRVAIAFHGTSSDPTKWSAPNPSYAPDDADWHLYLVLAVDAHAPDPTFTAFQLTPPDDPTQRGCIWHQGTAADESCRNMEDFIAIGQHEGAPIVAFVDGCLACPSAAESRGRWFNIATLEGFQLFADRIPVRHDAYTLHEVR